MRWLRAAAVLLTAFLAGGCLTPLREEPARPSPAPLAAPAVPLVGVFAPGGKDSWSGVAEFTAATGIKPQVVVAYSDWNDPFRTDFAETARGHGAYLLVKMQPSGVPLASIAAGKSDAYLRSYARDVRSFGYPVLMSFGHEMNGTW